VEPSSGSNVIPRRARPGLADLRPDMLTRSRPQNDASFRQRAFVTDEDIRGISEFQDQTLIAIKAPTGAPLLPTPCTLKLNPEPSS